MCSCLSIGEKIHSILRVSVHARRPGNKARACGSCVGIEAWGTFYSLPNIVADVVPVRRMQQLTWVHAPQHLLQHSCRHSLLLLTRRTCTATPPAETPAATTTTTTTQAYVHRNITVALLPAKIAPPHISSFSSEGARAKSRGAFDGRGRWEIGGRGEGVQQGDARALERGLVARGHISNFSRFG